MKRGKILIVSFLFIISLLFSGGCSHTVEQTNGDGSGGSLAIAACFQREDGTALSHSTVRLSDGENSQDYPADREGCLHVSGLPTGEALEVSVLDGQGELLGTITLTFTQGAVIDAVTDENAVGHITLKEDTREIALTFTLCDDGALECELQLSEERVV